MAAAHGQVEVTMDADTAWEAVTDWEGQRYWVLGSRVRPARNGGREVGGTIVARTGYGSLTITDPMEITVWDPPRTATLRHTGRLVHGTATYRVEALGEHRSRVTWSEELTAPHPALQAVYAIGVPLFEGLIRLSLRRFARWAPRR